MRYRWFCLKYWFRERPEKISRWIAWKLARRVALHAFVRVYSTQGYAGEDYHNACLNWADGKGR